MASNLSHSHNSSHSRKRASKVKEVSRVSLKQPSNRRSQPSRNFNTCLQRAARMPLRSNAKRNSTILRNQALPILKRTQHLRKTTARARFQMRKLPVLQSKMRPWFPRSIARKHLRPSPRNSRINSKIKKRPAAGKWKDKSKWTRKRSRIRTRQSR